MKLSQAALLAFTAFTSSSVNAFVAPANKLHRSPHVVSETALEMGWFSDLFEQKPTRGSPLNMFSQLFDQKNTRGFPLNMGMFSELFEEKQTGTLIPPPESISEGQVRSMFYLWNDALATGDSDIVAKLYSEDSPVLLATVSDEPRTDYESIKDYFDNFLKLKPQGIIVDGKIKIGHNWARDAGIYEFTMGATGAKVRARYSFIYTFQDGVWKIAHHHSSVMPEANKAEQITKEQVKDLFYVWNDALATLDSDKVAKRYAENAVLLPTVSDTPRTDYDSIKDYFDNFLQLKPQGEILESHVLVGDNWCKDVGIYEFTMGKDGSKVKARYSFVYVFEDGEWKISHHHSSAMPESKIPQNISEEQVKDLFYLWNDALATLDSDVVAMRYAKNAVLLPTVSDTPRTNYDTIKEYFDNFLQLKPQGVILESHVVVGDNWCKDVGLYEFTMSKDGSKVKARYSFVYVYEDGEWKISHHHSSVMPEGILAAVKKVQEASDLLKGLQQNKAAVVEEKAEEKDVALV